MSEVLCLLKIRVCLSKANSYFQFSILHTIDRGKDLFREHLDHWLVFQDSTKFLKILIIYSSLKCLAHPSGWIAEVSGKLSSFCHSWENLKSFSLSFLYLGLIVSCIWLKMNSVLKMNFLLNIDPYPIPVINIRNSYL